MRLSYTLVALATAFSLATAHAEERTIRIGYQKYGTLVFEKTRGTLEKRLAKLNVRVTWTEFLGGPALLEGMNAGSIDFGSAGDAPPIFGQVAGVPLVYVGVEVPPRMARRLSCRSGHRSTASPICAARRSR